MPARQNCRTSRQVNSTGTLAAETVVTETEEPMRIWPHSICCDVPASCPADCSAGCSADCPDLSRVQELLQCQNQLLVDLLGAVNSLTAALLCQGDKN